MGVRSISDRRLSLTKGAGALALALFCVLAIALMQRAGWL
ncbi:phosphatase PAP2 family protein, partial [Sphingobium lactosutens]|nr:phosphatase PAP2 family protein [Sphingobium lactosutens]